MVDPIYGSLKLGYPRYTIKHLTNGVLEEIEMSEGDIKYYLNGKKVEAEIANQAKGCNIKQPREFVVMSSRRMGNNG